MCGGVLSATRGSRGALQIISILGSDENQVGPHKNRQHENEEEEEEEATVGPVYSPVAIARGHDLKKNTYDMLLLLMQHSCWMEDTGPMTKERAQ